MNETTTPTTEKTELEKVTLRRWRGGKAHRGLRWPDGSWRPSCSCPGAADGSLRNASHIIAEGWDKANCGN